jgi:DNA polymerase III alpha subunit (gram-positive type)
MKLPFNLVCIDIETTGLNMANADIVQLAAIITDEMFKPIPGLEFNKYIKPLSSYREPNAMKIHEINEHILNSSPTLEEVLIMFENFCAENKILASWGNYFDIPFLYKQYEKINRKIPFSYKSIDLKSIAIWERAKDDIAINGNIKKMLKSLNADFDGVEHNALNDIKNTIKLLNILKGRK